MSAAEIDTMNTGEIFQSTIASVPNCIEYCIDGISLYAIITPIGVTFYYTLNVSHNSPDLLVMTHYELDATPWKEFNSFFGGPYKKMVNGALQSIIKLPLEVGTGRERYSKYGRHQSVNSREATVLGHPASIILKMFDQGGLAASGYWVGNGKNKSWHQCKTNGCIEEENSPAGNSLRQEFNGENNTQANTSEDAANFLSGFGTNKSKNTTSTMLKHFGGNLKNINSVKDNAGLISSIKNLGGQVKRLGRRVSIGQSLFCPINITPFVPYYLSGLDGLQWRAGYPITDFPYSTTILNPLSRDTIGIRTFIGSEEWGHLYPRSGVIDLVDDSKAAIVIAARAADIVNSQNKALRIVNTPYKSNRGFGAWGSIFPEAWRINGGEGSYSCARNVAANKTVIQDKGQYAFNYWRRYNCDLRRTGIKITTFYLDKPLCLTPRVKEDYGVREY